MYLSRFKNLSMKSYTEPTRIRPLHYSYSTDTPKGVAY
jgi:hypothetical protein